jgi:glutathione S-transferase
MRTLVALPYSPWSEKARWALDYHHVDHTYEIYAPMMGEPMLRLRARRLTGPLSVPVLFDDGEVFADSFEIARRAEKIGSGASLFPKGKESEVVRWNERSQDALAAARALLLDRMATDDPSLLESMPPMIPRALRAPSLPVARAAIGFLARKYSTRENTADDHERALVDALDQIRAALSGDRKYILGEFSYADVAAAVVLQFVSPVDARFIRLGPATRAIWTYPALADRFPDLVAWRDAIYAEHRKPRA